MRPFWIASASSKYRTVCGTEEATSTRSLLRESTLLKAPCAPGTLPHAGALHVLSRLKSTRELSIYSKLRVYDGENCANRTQAKSVASTAR